MDDHKDYIEAARQEAAKEDAQLERDVALSRTESFFAREQATLGGIFEGFALSSLLALVPVLVVIGLAIWAFGPSGTVAPAAWVAFGAAGAVFVSAMSRTFKSTRASHVSLLTDMMAGFWLRVFPIVLALGLGVLGLATWLSIPFQAALALVFVLGLVGFFALMFLSQA